ncbi:MAG: hypothetical protein VZR53_10840 [Prevotella sp.]|nr:hypothetical protein [Prevotella sp.]
MARKATSKKTTTTKKTTSKKKSENIKLTFRPLWSASRTYTAFLTKKTVKVEHGTEVVVNVPMIEGLPTLLTVHAGEILEVTPEQFNELDALGFIESQEQVQRRQELERNLPKQHPERMTYDMLDNNIDNNIRPRQVSSLYNDKLIVVD